MKSYLSDDYLRHMQFGLFNPMQIPACPHANEVRWRSNPRFEIIVIHITCSDTHHLVPGIIKQKLFFVFKLIRPLY